MNRQNRQLATRRGKRNLSSASLDGPAAAKRSIDHELSLVAQLAQTGDLDQAESLCRGILQSHRKHPEALHYLGLIALQAGRRDEAVKLIKKAIARGNQNAHCFANLATAFIGTGELKQAAEAFRRAIALDPNFAEAYAGLGATLRRLGRKDEAVATLEKSVALDPANAGAYCKLGNALRGAGRHQDGLDAYRRAVALQPGYAAAHDCLGGALKDHGDFVGAQAAYCKALEIQPAYREAHSNLLYCMAHDPNRTAANILAESRRWDARHAAPLAALARPHGNEPDPDRRLRIGYVSPDFRAHAVSYFLEPLMAAHDHDRFEIFCYAEIANPDDTTARYREYADRWRPTTGLSDHEVAEQVRADGIDILVDLAGHTAGNRLLAFAERPAPVQVSHIVGLVQTTGMSAMDYVLTDSWVTGADCDAHYSEVPYRLDRCFLSFRPLPEWPAITPSPAHRRGYVTFGSLNNPSRITQAAIDAWAQVLHETHGARLILVHGQFGDQSMRRRIASAFEAHGLLDRISFDAVERGWPAGMDLYEGLDIALDTFPMNGGSTTFIALWMGLPVVTLMGETSLNRQGLSFLSAMELEENVAPDIAGYVSRATMLAADVDGLAELRAGLRDRMAASPLLGHAGLARAVEAAYRDMWKRWCTLSPSATRTNYA